MGVKRKMRLTQLEYYAVIAEHENLSHAALELGVTEAALSQVLKQLEEDIGASLFHRTNDGLRITPEGRLYYQKVREMLKLRDDMYIRLRASDGYETLRIGIGTAHGLQLFAKLMSDKQNDFLQIKSSITEGRSKSLLHMLQHGRLDCVLTPWNKMIEEDGFTSRLMRKENFKLLVSEKHPLAIHAARFPKDPPEIDISIFKNERFILTPLDTNDGAQEMRMLKRYIANPNILCYINADEAVVQMVRHQMGIGVLPLRASADIEINMEEICWCLSPERTSRYVQLVWRTEKVFSALQKKFFDRLERMYRDEIKPQTQ